MLIDSVLNTDAEEATSQMETNEASLTNTEIMNKTGEQDCTTTEFSKEESARELSVVLESNHRKKRYSRLKHAIDSDSDDEHERSTPDEESANLPVGKTHKKIALIDSDSEPDNDEESSKLDDETAQKPKRLAAAIFDSDPEEEESDKSDEENEDVVKTADANETDIYAFDKKGKLVSENNEYNKLYSRMSALWDPDTSSSTSGEENEGASATNEHESELPGVTRNVRPNKKSKPKQQRAAEAPKKLTGKEAMEQKREILSHSSRRARERQVSLPYHKPKHRSLQEFLQNRPRFADALPKHAAQARPSLAIKMSAEQLEAMSKNLEEREKKLEEFFKSESESEEEEPTNEVNSEDATVADQTMNCDKSEQSNDGGVNSGETPIQLNQNTEKEEEEVGGESAANSEESIVKEMDAVTNSEENCLNKKEEAATNVSPSSSEILDEGENCNVHENLPPQELEQKKLDDLIAKYSDVEATKCNEPSKTEQAEHKMKSKLELLRGDTLALREPRLRGNPNEVIDLDEGVTRPNEVTQLVERFMQHTFKKNHHKTKVHVDVISMVDGEIRKEILSVPVEPDEMEVIEKPGARLKKLQDELQTQMAHRRSELWKQKCHLQQGQNKNDDKTEGCDDAMLDDDDDDEEECEYTESEPEASDEELAQEKPRKKLAFADEEAEENDDELLNVRDEEKEEDAGKDDDDDDEIEEDDPLEVGDDGDDESEDNTQSEVKRKRKLKRIVQAFTDDSDDDDEAGEEEKPKPPPSLVAMQKSKADDSTDTWDDSGPPPNQQSRSNQTPRRREFSQTKSQLGFLTPVFRLTGLQNFNSGTKFLRESPVTPFNLDVPPSPTPPTSQALLQQKLFDEAPPNEENAKSQSTVVPPSPSKTPAEITNDTVPSTQDLLEICSGSFSPTEEGSIKPPENNTSVSGGEVSEAHPVPVPSLLNSNEIEESLQCKASADGDNDDRIISQLLDEEELENFKKKFESPLLKPNSQAAASVSPTKVGRFIFDSSDEETNEEKIVQKAAKQKKLVFSDEEEEEDCNYNILSEHSDDEEEEVDENEEKIVEYDSEENEIEGGLKPKPTFKVADFVENEAELSESDWGSADEDEKDLDELEFEQGDAETFDENKVRSDLERIHMRRILDDDNREVRLLQELLLEDGELHGTGRQRQFKWKNIDSANNEVEDVKEDAYVDEYAEGENEEQWRKLRYQRELFLKKMQNNTQENSDDDTCLAYESQVFKLGQAAIRRSNSQNTATDNERHFESTDIKQHRLLQVKRGSFLSRNDEVLTRLAEYSKVTTTNASTGAPVKNSRQFVFKSVEEVTVGGKKRRKPSDGTPTAIKKLRLSDLSPAAASARSENSSSRVKKLFGNW